LFYLVFPLCFTGTILLCPPPATVTVPVRAAAEEFSAILKVKEPLPLPLAGLNPLIHAADVVTAQLTLLVTVMGVVIPPT
jgi:hypothetical protein